MDMDCELQREKDEWRQRCLRAEAKLEAALNDNASLKAVSSQRMSP